MASNFAEKQAEDRERLAAQQTRDALVRFFTPNDATNLSNFARYYINPSPEFAAGVAQAGIAWDEPMLSELAARDAEEQQRPWWDLIDQGSKVARNLNPVIRGAAAVFEGVWEEGLPRLTRTAIKQYQNPDQSFEDSWRQAGASDLAYGIGEWANGGRVDWGEGLFPQSQPAYKKPGFLEDVTAGTQDLMSRGVDPTQAYHQTFESTTEEYLNRYGRDIVYDGQRIRENTIISKTRGGETYSSPFSFGRAAAIQVAVPGSTAFNFISGGIDAYARIAFDPLNTVAREASAWQKSRDTIMDPRMAALIESGVSPADAGLITYRRPWVNSVKASDWLTTGRGQRRIQFLADNTEIAKTRELLPGMSLTDQIKIAEQADTPAKVIDILKPYMGTLRMQQAPRISRTALLGNRVRTSDGFVSQMMPDRNSIGSTMWHRLTASSGDQILNIYNSDDAANTITEYLHAIEAPVEDVNDIIKLVATAEGDPQAMRQAVQTYMDVVKRRLVELGYDEDEITGIINAYHELQTANTEFLNNLAGEAIEAQGAGNYAIKAPNGQNHLIRLKNAMNDAELAEQVIVMPNMRNTRLMSSRVRAWNQEAWRWRMGWDPKGARIGKVVQSLDRAQSIWRNFALIRGGWMVRIVGEEAIRRNAAGYGVFMTHPGEAIALVMDSNFSPMGSVDNFGEYMETAGLGASGFRMDRENNPMQATKPDLSRANWSMEPTLTESGQFTDAGRHGLSNVLEQTNAAELNRLVGLHGVDGAIEFLKTPEGIEMLKRVRQKAANTANPMGRLISVDGEIDEVLLRQQLHYNNLENEWYAGGDGIYRNPDSDVWLDAMGNPVKDPRTLTSAEVRAYLDQPEVGRTNMLRNAQGHFRTTEDLLNDQEVWDIFGLPDLNQLEAQQLYAYVTKQGAEPARNFIIHGNSAAEMLPTPKPKIPISREFLEDGRLASTNLDAGTIRIDEVAIELDYGNDIAHLRGLDGTETGRTLAETMDELGVNLDEFKRWLDNNGGSTRYSRFIEEHEKAHVALHQGMEYPGVGTPGAYKLELEANRVALEQIGYPLPKPKSYRIPQIEGQLERLVGKEEWPHLKGVLDDPARSADEVIELAEKGRNSREAKLIREHKRIMAGRDEPLSVHPDMTLKDHHHIANNLEQLYPEGYTPPAMVRVPRVREGADAPSMGKRISDAAFHALGEKPTMGLIRQPFARVRYTEEMARAYIWSDAATRTRFLEWADEMGVSGIFQDFVDKHLFNNGLKKLPDMGDLGNPFTSFDDLDEIVLNKVIEDTKELFYDLTKKQNWADAIRFIAPFADAWQEVLTRWMTMLLSPEGGPGGIGQTMRNWERIRQGTQGMSQSSFFAEDQFGNETFNTPGFGMLFPGIQNLMQSTARPEQMMFIDPTIGSVMKPSAGPFMQLGAALVKPEVKKFLGQQAADTMDAFLFGDFASPRRDNLGDLAQVMLPSWIKRTLDVSMEEESRAEYADEIVQVFSALLNSGDPRFVHYDKASLDRTMEEARGIGTQLGFARILDAVVLPALPRYEAGVFVDIANHPDGGFWLTTAALGAELSKAEQMFGDPQAAVNYVLDTYGLNPLNVTAKTYSVRQRPTTQEGLQKLNENPEMKDLFRNTLMMFIPESGTGGFYYTAWDESIAYGDRVKVTPEMAPQLISRANGQARYRQLTEEYETALSQAERRFGTDTQTFRNYRDDLNDWRRRELYTMQAMYYAWDSPVEGQVTRPTYQIMFDELKQAAIPNTRAHEYAMDLSPELTDFLVYTTTTWDTLNQTALDRNFGHDWWRTSDAKSEERAAEVYALRKWFSDGVQNYIGQMTDEQAISGAAWVSEYVYSRLINGAEFDDEVFIAVQEPGAPPAYADVNDSMVQEDEIIAPIGLGSEY